MTAEAGCELRTPEVDLKVDFSWRGVREWSADANKSLFSPELAQESLHYLQQVTAFRSKILNSFVDDFNDDPDSALPHLQILLSAPARTVATAFEVNRVESTDKISDVAKALDQNETVVISGSEDAEDTHLRRDLLLGSTPFFYKAITCVDFDQPVSSIVNDIQELPTMHNSCFLNDVLRVMCVSHVSTVGIYDDSYSIIAIVKFADIFSAVLKEIEVLYQDDKSKGRHTNEDQDQGMGELNREEQDDDDDEDDMLASRTTEERKTLKQAVQGRAHVSRLRRLFQEWVESPSTEFLIMSLLVLDMTLTIWEAVTPDEEKSDILQSSSPSNPLMVITGAILFVFTYESLIRVLGYGWNLLDPSRILDLVDILVVVVSIAAYVYTLASDATMQLKVITFARVIRFMRILKFARRLRKWVGSNKRRFRKDGFDLDLTYITPSCIAMSLPALGSEANYRNPILDVSRFFKRYHDRQYLIFNLCAERAYDPAYFDGRVVHIKVEDHNPPFFEQLVQFINRAEQFMIESPQNVIALHCKGGKGRTGVFTVAWLIFSQFRPDASEALSHFAQRRTSKGKREQGVSGASQRRYVEYFHTALLNGGFRVNKLRLLRICVVTCPRMKRAGGCNPWVALQQGGKRIFSSKDADELVGNSGRSSAAVSHMKQEDESFDFEVNRDMQGDIRLMLYDQDLMTDAIACFLWFHTGFITQQTTEFVKSEIDMAAADHKCKVFSADFKIILYFADVPPSHQDIMRNRVEHNNRQPANGHEAESFAARHPAVLKGVQFQASMPTITRLLHTEPADAEATCESSRLRRLSNLGAFREMPKPSERTLERTAQYRGANKRCSNFRGTFEVKISAPEDDGDMDSLVPVPDNLCIAPSPEVRHDRVHLVCIDTKAVVSHGPSDQGSAVAKQEKKLLKYYRNASGFTAGAPVSAVSNRIRALVSLNKKRFQEDGFDLDLTYITPRLIAMGYPAASGLEGAYRNSADDVYRFFQERHAGHFRLVNLVAERGYDLDMYHGSVATYPFYDHNPPAMELLLPACAHMHLFLQADEDNVVAVHCKAGKGRTGLILVCYLIFGGLHRTAASARAFYDKQRCHDCKGLTIISQIRYAHYFEEYLRRLRNGVPCPLSETQSPAVTILAVEMNKAPRYHGSGCEPSLKIAVRNEADHGEYVIFSSKTYEAARPVSKGEEWCLSLSRILGKGVRTAGDVKVIVCHDISSILGDKETSLLHVWVHSQFMHEPPSHMGGISRELSEDECSLRGMPIGTRALRFRKHEIDGASKDAKHTNFDADFSLEIFWKFLPNMVGTGEALTCCAQESPKDSALKRKDGSVSTYQRDKEEYLQECQDRLEPRSIEAFLMDRSADRSQDAVTGGLLGTGTSPVSPPGSAGLRHGATISGTTLAAMRESRGFPQAMNHSSVNLLAEVSKVHKADSVPGVQRPKQQATPSHLFAKAKHPEDSVLSGRGGGSGEGGGDGGSIGGAAYGGGVSGSTERLRSQSSEGDGVKGLPDSAVMLAPISGEAEVVHLSSRQVISKSPTGTTSAELDRSMPDGEGPEGQVDFAAAGLSPLDSSPSSRAAILARALSRHSPTLDRSRGGEVVDLRARTTGAAEQDLMLSRRKGPIHTKPDSPGRMMHAVGETERGSKPARESAWG